jgi:hypothetical protein
MLNVRRVEEDDELHDDLMGEIWDEEDEVVEIGEELILLGERIRLVNEPNLVKGIGGVGTGEDGDELIFVLSSLSVVDTVISNLSSLIRKDSDLESIYMYGVGIVLLIIKCLLSFYRNKYL